MFRAAARSTKNHKNNHFLAYSALTTVTLLWSLAGPVIKYTLAEIPPMHFLFFRLLIVCIILLPATIIQLKRKPFRHEEIPTLIALGLLSQSCLALTFLGYKFTTVLDAAIISLISPLLSVAAGHIYYNEEMSKKTKIGIILATIGTIGIVIEPLLTNGAPLKTKELRVLGNLLILTATISFLLYTVWSKYAEGAKSKKMKNIFHFFHLHKMKHRRSPLEITFITFYIGLATTIPLVILENRGFFGPIDFSLAAISTETILGILYMAVFASIAANTLFEWSLRIASIADTAFFNYLSPVFTLPFAYLLLGETPTKANYIGAGIIAAGVLIAEHKKN